MKLTFGAFKELYNGSGIYWAGCYNIEGDGEFRTIGEARAQIDKDNAAYALRELNEKLTAVRQGAIACVFDGDIVTVHTSPVQTMTRREFRWSVFDIIDRENRETVNLNPTEFAQV